MVPRQVRGDGEQPGGKSLFRAKTFAGLENADERFLREIVRVIFIANHAAEKMKHRRRVAFHQVIERGIIASG
jgi:hypothetical protein